MNRGRYPTYGMYLNRRVNKLNCCCEPGATGPIGPAGPTGYTGPTGMTGPTGPQLNTDNFVFGLTTYETPMGGTEYWLVPGGDINPGFDILGATHDLSNNYKMDNSGVLCPSMAICYSLFNITNAAIHLTKIGSTSGWGGAKVKVKIYSFCNVDSSGNPDAAGMSVTTPDISGSCTCVDISNVPVGCDATAPAFLAVSFKVDTLPLPITPPFSISVTLGTASVLTMPT